MPDVDDLKWRGRWAPALSYYILSGYMRRPLTIRAVLTYHVWLPDDLVQENGEALSNLKSTWLGELNAGLAGAQPMSVTFQKLLLLGADVEMYRRDPNKAGFTRLGPMR